jgi:hypothetical protein
MSVPNNSSVRGDKKDERGSGVDKWSDHCQGLARCSTCERRLSLAHAGRCSAEACILHIGHSARLSVI